MWTHGPRAVSKRDYYEVLGVDRGADEKALKNAFRRLARRYHPDRSDEEHAEDRFKEIQEAYAVLSDPQKRANYDRFGHDGPGMSGFGGGGINISDLFGGADIFSSFFGGGGGGRERRRGADMVYHHTVRFEDVMNGSEEEVELDLPVACTPCEGTGAEGALLDTCEACGGRGVTSRVVQMGPFQTRQDRPCTACSGRGRTARTSCGSCRGRGRVDRSTTLRFNIPPGAEDGTRLRLRGKGEPGRDGQPAGDLFVEIDVAPHAWFERNRNDLIMSLPLGFADLALGTTVSLDHVDGAPLDIKVPKGSSAGDTIEIQRRGLPRLRGGGRGDVVVLLKLHMPSSLSKSTKRALEELRADLAPADVVARVRAEADERRRNG